MLRMHRMATELSSIDDLPFEALAQEAPKLRERLGRLRRSLARFFVGRERVIDLMMVAAVAQEPLLLVGPPGTAKSELVIKFK
jgi:MoxR-like ATPase